MKMDEKFLTYSALDSACMMEIHNNFWETLTEDGYFPTYKMTTDLYPVLTFMQTRGMKVNHQLLEETRREVLEKAAILQEELNTLIGKPLNVNSPKACAEYFYVTLSLPPIYNGKTKKVTTDDKAMQRLVRGTAKHPGIRQAKLVQDIRGLQKLYSTYLSITFDSDDRLRGAYNPRGTKFGRLSSSQTIFGTGMNFQNLPQDFKKFLVADEGYMLVEVDKRQAEWVVVAYFANDANMISAIKNNLDVHSHTASLMFDLPIEIVKYENELIGHATSSVEVAKLRQEDPILKDLVTSKWPRSMSLRQCGKKSNHGLNYDEGYKNFALINEMEETEAKRIVAMYHSIYPGIKISYEVIKRQLQKDRTLSNCFGRKVRFMGEWGNDLWKSSYSMIPQSTVVDSLNKGMVRIYHDRFLTEEMNIDILAQVHDSILMQIPLKNLQNETLYNKIFQTIYSYITPEISYNNNSFTIKNDAKFGKNWGGFNKNTNTQGMRDLTSFDDLTAYFAQESSNVSGTQ